MSSLWIVLPVYNEAANLDAVFASWLPVLEATVDCPYVVCALNDGSTDDSLAVLQRYAASHSEIQVVDKPNSGHGQTCLAGYRLALSEGADWVFQIDSDGQCDPTAFPTFWAIRDQYPVLFGYRSGNRGDGVLRFMISRVVSVVTFLATGTWVRDANVPYRLMHRDALGAVVDRVPADFHLANIPVAVLLERCCGIHWVPIPFSSRQAGEAGVNGFAFLKLGVQLFRQLRGMF